MAYEAAGAPRSARGAGAEGHTGSCNDGRASYWWIRILVAAVSFVILVGSGVAWATFKNFTSNVPQGDAVPPLTGGAQDLDGKDQNILLVGNDSRAGASPAELKALRVGHNNGEVNTDTMMLLHVPANGSRATIVSFPRDSWVSIPGHGKGKINSAYGDGYSAAKSAHKSEKDAQSAGLIMTIRTISALTGLHIDHYMQVNLLGFYRISNAIGGVTVCLNKAQNATTDADQFRQGYSGIDLPKGVSVIQGKQALAFVRQRHGLPNGDLDRIKRQQYFLASAFRKVESAGVLLNPFKLRDLLHAVGTSLLVDPDLDLLSLAREFQQMSAGKITFKTIPNNGPQVIYPDGVETAIVGVNTAAMPAFVNELHGQGSDSAYASAKAAARSTVTVDVLNGTNVAGLAGRNMDKLRALGFKVNVHDSTDASAATVIEYPRGMESQAKALSAVVTGAKVVETPDVHRVTLVLGNNDVRVNGLGAASTKTAAPKATKPAVANGLGCIN